jgi:hypothetical protein
MKKYGHEKAKLMMTDTDSLLHIQCQNAGTLRWNRGSADPTIRRFAQQNVLNQSVCQVRCEIYSCIYILVNKI